MNKVFAIIMIIGGLNIIREPKFSFRGSIVDFSAPILYIPIASFFILIGLRVLYYEFIKKNKD